jgi:CubicO group peptidase (beta-lactamase class C family)
LNREALAALDTFLEKKLGTLRLPGLAVAVVQDGRIAYLRGLGAAAPGRPMTPQTPLVVGSISKSFTALAALQLAEAGKLEMDAPIQRYLPWFRLADAEAAASITTKHLLTHTSGISRYDGRILLAGRGGKTIEQSVRELSTLKLSKPVGAAFQYSNVNYMIVGLVVEVVSGQSFGAYVEEHIFRPLGMEHSFSSENAALHGGLASGYRWVFGWPLPFHAPYLTDAVPAAFLIASAADLARYMLALLNGGSFDGVSVLSPAGVTDLHRPQVVTASPGSWYTLGWRREKLRDEPIIRHGGEVSNFLAEIILVPGQQLGIAVLMNVNNGLVPIVTPQVSRLGSDVTRFLLGMPEPRRRLSLRGFYAGLDVALIALSIYQVWSVARLLRSGSADRGRSALGIIALVEVGLAAVGLRFLPRLADSPWRLLRLYVPDLTSWLAAFFSGSLLKLALLLVRWRR